MAEGRSSERARRYRYRVTFATRAAYHSVECATLRLKGAHAMQASTDRILTTHAGSMPRPSELADLNTAKMRGEAYDEQARSARIPGAVRDVVRRQVEVGLDVINDGEG